MQDILFPPGRLVGGSVYTPREVTDNFGKPKIGHDGKVLTSYSFGIAFPKTTQHWNQTEWGAKVWAEGIAGFPNGEFNAPSFAWKVTDGDSTIPNKRGNKPCDNEGYKGHWVVWFSGTFAPTLVDKYGTAESRMLYADGVERIKPGHMIQVFGSVKDNKPSQSPGVYMNFSVVAHNDDTTPVIDLRTSVDTTKVGFGGGAAPAPVYAPPAAPVPQAAPTPVPVVPNTTYMAPPPAAPAAPPAAPAGPVMTAKANGLPYQSYISAGWTHEQLVQNGYVTA